MASGQPPTLLDPIRRLIGQQGASALSDTELLEQFVRQADAASFEVLVWRHGAMVLSLCHRILRDAHEAEDAFQATFLVFARKAGSIGRREAVGCWLYKVAYRAALRLRAAAAKRPTTATPGESPDELPAPEPADDADWRDLRPVLDEEIARLPEKYRAPFVLCYLEGRTNEEAALQLGCPKGTILSRLSRGREWLRSRLTRRGVVLSAASLPLILSRNAVSAAVPAVLTRSTVDAAIPFAAGKAATVLVSAPVAALTEGVLRAMILTNVKIAAAALLALTVMGTGIGWAARGDGASTSSTTPATTPIASTTERPAIPTVPVTVPAVTEPISQPVRGEAKPTLNGKVVAIAQDKKSFTIEGPAQVRGEEPSKTVIKLTEKTEITYNGVGLDGAKLTEGYLAQIHLENNSKDVAGSVSFSGQAGAGRRGPDVTGKLVSGTKDGKGITIELSERLERGADPKRKEIAFNDKTVVTYSNVAKGEAKITEGYGVGVWMADDGKAAGKVQLVGTSGEAARRDQQPPDLTGKVVAAAADGKTITVEKSAGRNEAPTRLEIKIGEKTPVLYQNVGPDGTKAGEGFHAQVWFMDGAESKVAKVTLTGTTPERWTTLSGKVAEVVAISKEATTIVLEQPATARGEEPTRTKIKIPTTVQFAFYGVGPDEAKLVAGMDVQIRLLDGTTDTAAQVMFRKGSPVRVREGRERE